MIRIDKRSWLHLIPILLIGAFCCLALVSCGKKGESPGDAGLDESPRAEIAVSTSWLECCVRDLGTSAESVLRVCPPGTCPGHFDVRPGIVADLRQCRMMFLFDFQQSMSEKMESVAPDGFQTFAVATPKGMCVPAYYLEGCETVREALRETYPERSGELDDAMEKIRARINALEDEIKQQIEPTGLLGTKVVASGRQAAFCQWLGLNPVAAYSGTKMASPAQIDALLSKGKSSGVRFVIANLQEGVQAGEALADRFDIPIVVFSNFPSMTEGDMTFDDLVRSNVAKLIQAAAEAK